MKLLATRLPLDNVEQMYEMKVNAQVKQVLNTEIKKVSNERSIYLNFFHFEQSVSQILLRKC